MIISLYSGKINLYLVSFTCMIKQGFDPMNTVSLSTIEPKFSPVIVNFVDPSSGPFAGLI